MEGFFFAGEATTRRYPATMHGAFLSGLREAAHIAHYTSNRALRTKVERNQSKNAHSCASLLADLFREPDLEFGCFSVIFATKNTDPTSTAILRVTFSGPRKKSYEGSRPDQQHSNKLLFQQLQSHFNQQQELHVYTLLSRQQALELREVRGGDEMRLNYLCEKLGVKLVGRKGLGPSADYVIASIKAERAKRKLASTSIAPKSGTSKPKGALKQKFVRKAKVVRKNNGSYPSQDRNVGGKVVVVNTGSTTPPTNRDLEVKIGYNGSPNLSARAESLDNVNGYTPAPNMAASNINCSAPPNIHEGNFHGWAPHPTSNVVYGKPNAEIQ